MSHVEVSWHVGCQACNSLLTVQGKVGSGDWQRAARIWESGPRFWPPAVAHPDAPAVAKEEPTLEELYKQLGEPVNEQPPVPRKLKVNPPGAEARASKRRKRGLRSGGERQAQVGVV